jgi:hypothetical protein
MYKRKNYVIPALGLEIFYNDLPFHRLWSEYNSLCLVLRGGGWRAPTLHELQYMYSLHNLGVMGFSSGIYWSSDIPYDSIDRLKSGIRYCVNFDSDVLDTIKMNIHTTYQKFRPVRSINI